MPTGREIFRQYISAIEAMSEEEKRQYLDEIIEKCRKLQAVDGMSYRKIPIRETPDSTVMWVCWAPGASTRPHKHLEPEAVKGSEATICVVRGSLCQELFAIWSEDYEDLGGNTYQAGEKFVESPGSVHQVGNVSSGDWALSLHLFEPPLHGMEVYDFDIKFFWTVQGDEYTVGEPPPDALPIWPRS